MSTPLFVTYRKHLMIWAALLILATVAGIIGPPAYAAKKGRPPVIIVPGLIGSELVNKKTGEKVWFSLTRAKDDDVRLPISPVLEENRDDLMPGDILRKIRIIRFTPEIEIYQTLLDELRRDGYTESKIDDSGETGATDTFYVFPYDWRLDNVENARILLGKMDGIRARSKRPDLKFDIIAHSMGGLITRYAAMYGTEDLPAKKTGPDWAGAGYFNTISLVATPNNGSLSALNSLINGFSFFGMSRINVPFVQNLSKFDLFTIPSIYQLMPHEGEARLFDENLKPLKLDIYSPETWDKYGWAAYADRGFADEFNLADQRRARRYFRAVLLRAKLFQDALNADLKKAPVPFYYLGSECRDTPDGMIIYKDSADSRWKTHTDIDSFTKSDGKKILRDELRPVLRSPGDGVVTKNSLTALMPANAGLTIVCGEHNRLTGDKQVTESLIKILDQPAIVVAGNPK